MTNEEIFISKLDNKFELVSAYKNSKTKIKLKHLECGNIFEIYPDNFIQGGKKCKYCHRQDMKKKYSKTTNEFKDDIYKLEGNKYTLMSEYINCHTKVKIKHNECGKIYEVCPTDFLSGYRCPKCKHSLGEQIIREYLTKNNYKFEEQYSFADCVFKRPLKFDFKIFINNSYILLEFDGIQHFKKMWYDSNFENQQKRDKIKDNYCKENNIPLIRIKYTEINDIDKILTETFRDYRNHKDLIDLEEESRVGIE